MALYNVCPRDVAYINYISLYIYAYYHRPITLHNLYIKHLKF